MESDTYVHLAFKALHEGKKLSIGFCGRQNDDSVDLLTDLIKKYPQFSKFIAPLLEPQICPNDPYPEIGLGDLDFTLKGNEVIVKMMVMEMFKDVTIPTQTIKMSIQDFELFCNLVKDFACFVIDGDFINMNDGM